MCIDNEPSSNVSSFLTAFPKNLTPQLEDVIIKCVLKRFGDRILADGNTVRGRRFEKPQMLEEYESEIKTAQSAGLSPHFRVVEEFGEPFYEGDFLEDLFSSMAVADPEHFTYILGEF